MSRFSRTPWRTAISTDRLIQGVADGRDRSASCRARSESVSEVMGVRSSCDATVRNSSLRRTARSVWRWSRALSMAMAARCASRSPASSESSCHACPLEAVQR